MVGVHIFLASSCLEYLGVWGRKGPEGRKEFHGQPLEAVLELQSLTLDYWVLTLVQVTRHMQQLCSNLVATVPAASGCPESRSRVIEGVPLPVHTQAHAETFPRGPAARASPACPSSQPVQLYRGTADFSDAQHHSPLTLTIQWALGVVLQVAYDKHLRTRTSRTPAWTGRHRSLGCG